MKDGGTLVQTALNGAALVENLSGFRAKETSEMMLVWARNNGRETLMWEQETERKSNKFNRNGVENAGKECGLSIFHNTFQIHSAIVK